MGRGKARPPSRAAPRHGIVLPVRELARWWVRGLINPVAVMRALPDAGRPKAGRAGPGGPVASPHDRLPGAVQDRRGPLDLMPTARQAGGC